MDSDSLDDVKCAQFTQLLLDWFAQNKREFPWRPARSAYGVAVAEALLQKTAAGNAKRVFEEVIREYPTVEALAEADPEKLGSMLRPLGLPRRAQLLLQLAKRVVELYGGRFPESEEELRKLPGVGPYGAGAIASLAFGRRAPMIDINVMRVVGRVFSVKYSPRSGPSKQLRQLVLALMPPGREAEFNLAFLDFGALVCRQRDPFCSTCPLAENCDYNRARGANGAA